MVKGYKVFFNCNGKLYGPESARITGTCVFDNTIPTNAKEHLSHQYFCTQYEKWFSDKTNPEMDGVFYFCRSLKEIEFWCKAFIQKEYDCFKPVGKFVIAECLFDDNVQCFDPDSDQWTAESMYIGRFIRRQA
jgi:hypothetical protein